jgi:hypothetical protein
LEKEMEDFEGRGNGMFDLTELLVEEGFDFVFVGVVVDTVADSESLMNIVFDLRIFALRLLQDGDQSLRFHCDEQTEVQIEVVLFDIGFGVVYDHFQVLQLQLRVAVDEVDDFLLLVRKV